MLTDSKGSTSLVLLGFRQFSIPFIIKKNIVNCLLHISCVKVVIDENVQSETFLCTIDSRYIIIECLEIGGKPSVLVASASMVS